MTGNVLGWPRLVEDDIQPDGHLLPEGWLEQVLKVADERAVLPWWNRVGLRLTG
jgi:hypothetical protein